MSALAVNWEYSWSRDSINILSGPVTMIDAIKSSSACKEGLAMPKPPNLAGRASSFLSISLGGGRPVMCGMRSVRSMSSSLELVPSHAGQCEKEMTLYWSCRESEERRRHVVV